MLQDLSQTKTSNYHYFFPHGYEAVLQFPVRIILRQYKHVHGGVHD